MNLGQGKKIFFGFGLSAFLVLIIFYYSYQSFLRNQDSGKSINHTQEVIRTLEKTLALTVDVETSQRGFAITGNESLLDPMNSSMKHISVYLDSLQWLTANDPQQSKRVEELRKMILRKIEYSIQTVELRKRGDEKAVFEFISSLKGKEIMDSIRTQIDTMRNEEVVQLNLRITTNREAVVHFNLYLSLLLFVIVVMLISVSVLLNNYLKQLKYSKHQLEQLTEELTYQNGQLTEFAYIVSHNVRAPAANIQSLIDLIEENSSIEEYKTIFDKLKRVGTNLSETLAELIDILQIKKDVNKERQLLNFEEILQKSIDNLEGLILGTQALISKDFSKAPEINYPKVYLESILLNLVSNALKYRSPDRTPEITISTSLVNGQIILKVSDNGLGIDLNKHGNKLFGLRKTFHRNEDAKGLGLFMTKSQVEAMGGNIYCESSVDKGTTFTVVFNKTPNA